MWSVVIPAYNEEGRIGQVIKNLSLLPLERIIVIVNGCKDGTVAEIAAIGDSRLDVHIFSNKLGIDVPRPIGAKIALNKGSQGVLFVDGDMIGEFNVQLEMLMEKVNKGWDMALLNCYPIIPYRHPLSALTAFYRAKLNRKLGLFHQLGIATLSHGPHALSRRLLETIPLEELAIPPVAMALAQKHGLQIGVAASITHRELQSLPPNGKHGRLVAQTIIGDHIEAITIAEGQTRSRQYHGKKILGYHKERRWDILKAFLDN